MARVRGTAWRQKGQGLKTPVSFVPSVGRRFVSFVAFVSLCARPLIPPEVRTAGTRHPA
jgi:hypothetical protein